jgi:hypothetical protein
MEAIMYCVGDAFHLESDRPANIREARFAAGGKSIILRRGESPAATGALRNILYLPDIMGPGTFRCTVVANMKPADIIFRSLGKVVKPWEPIENTVFEDDNDPNFALYARAISLCGEAGTECVVIEDTIAGIKAIREIERDEKGCALAVEDITFENKSKIVTSIMASIRDIAYFSELLEIYAYYDSWYGLILHMKRKGITPPRDDSLGAKREYLELCRAFLPPFISEQRPTRMSPMGNVPSSPAPGR